MKKILGLAIFSLAMLPVAANAKELYVNQSTGNDSVSYAANSASSPWATIGRAAWGSTNRSAPNSGEAARAGDTVHVAAGTYVTAGTGNRFDPAYNPANAGVSGSPITFVATGIVNLQLNSNSGPVVGAYGARNYITWDGFYIDEATAAPRADTGPVTVVGSQGVTIKNMTIKGISAQWDDNHNGIRIEGASNTLIQNNLIYGFGSIIERGQNDATIMLYDSNDTIIEHNEMHSSGAGVFVKGQHPNATQRRTIIRYNLIYAMGAQGITIGPAARDGKTYQNIIRDCVTDRVGIRLYDFGTGEGTEPINEVIANNTIDGCSYGVQFMGVGQNNRVMSNLISNSGKAALFSWNDQSPAGLRFEHNNYYAFTNFAELSNGNITFANWKLNFAQDLALPISLSSNPNYVDRAAKNFKLQPSSLSLLLGIDILDLNANGSILDVVPAGAYITGNEVIGRFTSGGSGVPSTPTNLRITPFN